MYIVNTLRDKNGLHAFGNNSAESEPIWMKCGTVWAKCGAGHVRFWLRSAQ